MADQNQLLGLQTVGSAAGDQLGQFFRFVDQLKVAAVLQRLGSSAEKIFRAAVVIPPGKGRGVACGATGEIRGIGNAAVKGAGHLPGKIPQIPA